MTNDEYLHKLYYDIRLRALTNRFYYQERQRIFELRDNLVRASSLIAGSFAFVNLLNQEILKIAIGVVTAGNALSLVFGFGAKSRDSAKRTTEWALLERDIEAKGARDYVESDLSTWSARCNELEAGEPAPNKRLLEQSYLRACTALGSTPETPSSRWNRLPAFFIP